MTTSISSADSEGYRPWNKGRLIGPKPPLKPQQIWAIRIRLELGQRRRDLALFDLAIDSKLRGCDLVRLRVRDVAHGGRALSRALVVQRKTGQPVKFELTEQTRQAVEEWIASAGRRSGDYLFPCRLKGSPHLSTRQYARIVKSWVESIELDPTSPTHRRPQCQGSALCSQVYVLQDIGLTISGVGLCPVQPWVEQPTVY